MNVRGLQFGDAFLGLDVVDEDLRVGADGDEAVAGTAERHGHRLSAVLVQRRETLARRAVPEAHVTRRICTHTHTHTHTHTGDRSIASSYYRVKGVPLLSAGPAVTFPAAEHHRPLAGTKLYCGGT